MNLQTQTAATSNTAQSLKHLQNSTRAITSRLTRLSALVLCSLALLPGTVRAAYIIAEDSSLVPTGLGVGDSFQLVFVTSTTTTREDTPGGGSDTHLIDFWNTYVNTAADGSSLGNVPDITWYAAASTIGTAANANAAVSSDVYRLDGVLVDTAASFWDSTIQNPINIDENGDSRSGVTTWGGGTKYVNTGDIGFDALGNGTAGSTVGRSDRTGDSFQNSWWSDADRGFVKLPGVSAHFYAISEVITVAPVPEPSSTALLGLGGLALILRRKRK